MEEEQNIYEKIELKINSCIAEENYDEILELIDSYKNNKDYINFIKTVLNKNIKSKSFSGAYKTINSIELEQILIFLGGNEKEEKGHIESLKTNINKLLNFDKDDFDQRLSVIECLNKIHNNDIFTRFEDKKLLTENLIFQTNNFIADNIFMLGEDKSSIDVKLINLNFKAYENALAVLSEEYKFNFEADSKKSIENLEEEILLEEQIIISYKRVKNTPEIIEKIKKMEDKIKYLNYLLKIKELQRYTSLPKKDQTIENYTNLFQKSFYKASRKVKTKVNDLILLAIANKKKIKLLDRIVLHEIGDKVGDNKLLQKIAKNILKLAAPVRGLKKIELERTFEEDKKFHLFKRNKKLNKKYKKFQKEEEKEKQKKQSIKQKLKNSVANFLYKLLQRFIGNFNRLAKIKAKYNKKTTISKTYINHKIDEDRTANEHIIGRLDSNFAIKNFENNLADKFYDLQNKNLKPSLYKEEMENIEKRIDFNNRFFSFIKWFLPNDSTLNEFDNLLASTINNSVEAMDVKKTILELNFFLINYNKFVNSTNINDELKDYIDMIMENLIYLLDNYYNGGPDDVVLNKFYQKHDIDSSDIQSLLTLKNNFLFLNKDNFVYYDKLNNFLTKLNEKKNLDLNNKYKDNIKNLKLEECENATGLDTILNKIVHNDIEKLFYNIEAFPKLMFIPDLENLYARAINNLNNRIETNSINLDEMIQAVYELKKYSAILLNSNLLSRDFIEAKVGELNEKLNINFKDILEFKEKFPEQKIDLNEKQVSEQTIKENLPTAAKQNLEEIGKINLEIDKEIGKINLEIDKKIDKIKSNQPKINTIKNMFKRKEENPIDNIRFLLYQIEHMNEIFVNCEIEQQQERKQERTKEVNELIEAIVINFPLEDDKLRANEEKYKFIFTKFIDLLPLYRESGFAINETSLAKLTEITQKLNTLGIVNKNNINLEKLEEVGRLLTPANIDNKQIML